MPPPAIITVEGVSAANLVFFSKASTSVNKLGRDEESLSNLDLDIEQTKTK